MTSWPWMDGIDIAMADPPIDPVCGEYDQRPAVKDLIKEYNEKIAKIKVGVLDHPEYNESKHDDLWLLRFYLSHKKSSKAIDAAIKTLEFRKTHDLDKKDIRAVPPHRVNNDQDIDDDGNGDGNGKVGKFMSYMKDGAIIPTHPDSKRGVILFVKPSNMEQHKMVQELSEDYWLPTFIYITEWSHQWLDYVTRTTGRLTRSVRFLDPEGMNFKVFSRECMKRNANAINNMEDYYPQLLEAAFICNPPKVIKAIFDIFRPLLPERLKKKINMVNPTTNEKERTLLFNHINEDNLPIKYGGKNTVPPSDWEPM